MKPTRGYGQFCPLAKAAEILAERWTLLVIRELLMGSTRFSELRRGVPLMSPSLLSLRLRQLEDARILARDQEHYRLTAAGEELRPIVEGIGVWGQRHARSRLEKHDLDPSLLMWDIRRRIDAATLPPGRHVIRFELGGTKPALRRWWLVNEEHGIELCLDAPKLSEDLVVEAHVRTL